jgi:hypothetical protein
MWLREVKHMASGGARARSGPAPDPNALRRDRKSGGEWLTLPSEGRSGDAPPWPLELLSPRESQLWESLWMKPVAILWERDQQFEYVAMYVRTFVEAEERGASASYRTLVRQMAGELLLTIPAMHAARVKIASDEVAEKRDEPAARPKSARDRMKVVTDGAGG